MQSNNNRKLTESGLTRLLGLAGLGLLVGGSLTTLQACDPGDVCDLSCPDEGILEGNASISGVAQVDSFFGAVVDVTVAADGLSDGIRSELEGMAAALGIEGYAEMSIGDLGAAVKGGIDAKLSAAVSGGLSIKAEPAKCEASVDVAVAAAAECDATVDPGSAEVQCSGSCEAEAGVMASCSADATLKCTGTAPNFECSGSCSGSCELDVSAGCEGTCRGACDGECSVRDSQGNCAGECMGNCQGTCELSAGGTCDQKCTGQCTYEAPMGGCEANATAKCEASADASVQCEGRCEGSVEPPEVSAECEASVEAKANASVECTPPSLEITWQWSAEYEADANLQAEFKAWLTGFKGNLGGLLAARAKADILINSLGNLSAAAEGAVKGSLDAIGSGDIVATFKLSKCALPQLPLAAQRVEASLGDLTASASASVEVFGSIGM